MRDGMQIVKKVVDPNAIKPENVILIDMGKLSQGVEEFKDKNLMFNVYTYANLRYGKPDFNWAKTFKLVNEFLMTLTEEEHVALGLLFVKANKLVRNLAVHDNLIEAIDEIGKATSVVFTTHKLSAKVTQFIRTSHINIPGLEMAGKEDHHTKEDTFMKEDYILTTSVALICKMFCPIFGQIIDTTRKDLDSSLKEIHCIGCLKYVFDSDFRYITNKLQDYLNKRSASWTNSTSMTNSYSGYTDAKFGLFLYGSTLVKKFVNVDLYDPDCDIVTYMFSCAKNTISNLNKNMRNKHMVKPRIDPNDDSIDGNDSKLETESVTSITTVDVPILTEFAVDIVINQQLYDLEFDTSMYEEIASYYNGNPTPVTPINNLLIATTLGTELGGARGIELLNAEAYNKLIAYLQMYMIHIGMTSLVHAMSVVPTTSLKTGYSSVDVRLDQNRGSSHGYKSCTRLYPYDVGRRSWKFAIDRIVSELIGTVYVYNTPGCLWDKLGEQPANGNVFVYEDTIIRDILEFINHVIELQEGS